MTKTFYLELHHVAELPGPLELAKILAFIPELEKRSFPNISVNQITNHGYDYRIDIMEITIPSVSPAGDLYIYSLGKMPDEEVQIRALSQLLGTRLQVLGGEALAMYRAQLGLQVGLYNCDIRHHQKVFTQHLAKTIH